MTRSFSTKLMLSLVATTALTILPQSARADDAAWTGKNAGDIIVRARVIGVLPEPTSTISVIGGQAQASNTAVPEVDFSYFFTQNIAAELIAATTRHDMSATGTALGNVGLGHVRLLPPTLTLQYHFMPQSEISPYVGAGFNWTLFYSAHAPGGLISRIGYENNFGAALQAGVDYHINGNWYANLDVKHIFLDTTAKIDGGAVIGKVSLDPTIIGVGVGYKF